MDFNAKQIAATVKKNTAPLPKHPDPLTAAAAKAKLTPEAFRAVRLWLVDQMVANEFAKLGQGGHTQDNVPLQRVFVDLPVADLSVADSPVAGAQRERRVPFLTQLLASPPLDLWAECHLDRLHGGGAQLEQRPRTEEWHGESGMGNTPRDANKSSYSATVLVGGPGQGKSTLGQLACQLQRAALLRPFTGDMTSAQRELVGSFESTANGKPGQGGAQVVAQGPLRTKTPPALSLRLPTKPLLPLQIPLPDLSGWLAKQSADDGDGQMPLLLQFLASRPSAKRCGLGAASIFALACKLPTLIVLDGFDEVGALQDRSAIVDAARALLTGLAQHGAKAQIIATTRPQGYAGELAELGFPLKTRYLLPLEMDEALAYAEKLVAAQVGGADLQEKTLNSLREAAAEPATARLLATPLQVTILTALTRQLGRAPRERWKLFLRYFTYTYDREVERGSYASVLLAEHRLQIEQIHARVGLLLQVEAEQHGGGAAKMSRGRLQEVAETVLAEDGVADAERKDLVDQIMVAAEQRLVFLVEPEPGGFGFEIRSLQEFMAAWALTTGRESEIEARLSQIAKAPMFRNVLLFVASRLFSEGSALRGIFAERICVELDTDPADEPARSTLAGAMLALELLEEGTVQAQPRNARALMERACKLLALPPGREHGRLADAMNADTEPVLAAELEKLVADWVDRGQTISLGVWLATVRATDYGKDWAIRLGDVFLKQFPDLAL